MSKRTITLTNRPPVSIEEDKWPEIASATDKEWDNQYESKANQISKWSIRVRQHEDGRAIVYATYSTSNWANSRDYAARHGDYLPYEAGFAHICASIINVAHRMADCEANGDAARWKKLGDDCIADLPPEDLDAPTTKADVTCPTFHYTEADCPHNWLGGYCDLCGAVKPV